MDSQAQDVPSSSGRKTVLLMFSFGILMVAALWLYWELYTRPFRPLQNAIVRAYPGSRPSVIGGRYKSHQAGNPRILRVVQHLALDDFNIESSESECNQRAMELARLADQHLPLQAYDELEIHLVQRPQEQPQRHWEVSHSISDWKALLQAPTAVTSEGMNSLHAKDAP